VFAAKILDTNDQRVAAGHARINLKSIIIGDVLYYERQSTVIDDIRQWYFGYLQVCLLTITLAISDILIVILRQVPAWYEIQCTYASGTPFQSIQTCVRMKQAVKHVSLFPSQ
jgi:hypothetical protein